MKLLILAPVLFLVVITASCKKSKPAVEPEVEVVAGTAGIPPETWQEHWDVHSRLLKRVYYDDNVAVYDDPYMIPGDHAWVNKTMGDTWAYVKKTYGDFGNAKDPRLYVVLHRVTDDPTTAPYGGGHPATYLDASHDFRNEIDCGLGNWTSPYGQTIGMPVHEVGHIVCGGSNGVKGSPSDYLWGDSKFMEIFNYDVLMNIGREDEASTVYTQMQNQDPYADYPGKIYNGVNWFMDWFYPIYTAHGKGALLGKYFKVLADNYPKVGNVFTRNRNMNLGEFVHFWSGAAGVNLKEQAKTAFGSYWSASAEAQLRIAQEDFPNVKYPY